MIIVFVIILLDAKPLHTSNHIGSGVEKLYVPTVLSLIANDYYTSITVIVSQGCLLKFLFHCLNLDRPAI